MSRHRWPEYAQTLPEVLAGLRHELEVWLLCHPLSLKQLGQQVRVNRRTLGRWLAGEDNVSVRTVLRIATWLRDTPLRPSVGVSLASAQSPQPLATAHTTGRNGSMPSASQAATTNHRKKREAIAAPHAREKNAAPLL